MGIRTFLAPMARLSLALALLTAGCGFHPIYATPEKSVSMDLAQVHIGNIPDRSGQELRNLLIDKMNYAGRPATPLYELTVTIQESRSDLGIRTDATSARSQIALLARYTLTPRNGGQPLLNAHAATHVGYNKLDAQYSNLSSEEDARRRGLNELSEQIVNRLGLYFSGAAEHAKATQ